MVNDERVRHTGDQFRLTISGMMPNAGSIALALVIIDTIHPNKEGHLWYARRLVEELTAKRRNGVGCAVI